MADVRFCLVLGWTDLIGCAKIFLKISKDMYKIDYSN